MAVMLDTSLAQANRMMDEAGQLSTKDVARFLFDHYRCARPEMQDAIVLALIGSVLTTRAMSAGQLQKLAAERLTR